MTNQQQITVNALKSQGFVITYQMQKIRMERGNDKRVIHEDGSMRRAEGARR